MTRLQRIRTVRALAVLLAAWCAPALASHTAAQSDGSPMYRRWSNRVVVISGRVVDARGQPVGGAQVDLMSHDTPHRAPYALVTTTTDPDGRFELPRRRALSFAGFVVTARGSAHAYRLNVYDDGVILDDDRAEIRLGDLPIGSLRDLLVSAECATEAPSDPSWMGIWITIEWRGHGLLRPRVMPEGLSFLDPGDSGSRHQLMRRSPGERRFERRLSVPPGIHYITVMGGCGDARARVIVPAEGAVTPVHLQLGDPR